MDAIDQHVIILGAGPAGLAQAIALHEAAPHIKITIIDLQSQVNLATPKEDGRAIALNQSSKTYLEQLGVWQLIDLNEIHPLKDAKVSDGFDPYVLHFERQDDATATLGYFVRNAFIKKALYQKISQINTIEWCLEQRVKDIQTNQKSVTITLDNDDKHTADLLIAADGRFSYTRKLLGISAKLKDFSRTMMVFEMKHTADHHQTAHEHFLYDQMTCAILPLNGGRSSLAMTLTKRKADQFEQMDQATFEITIEKALNHQLGKMTLVSEKHSYPLIGMYADRFYAQRTALIGDAAVGMHPVTAHGFNLGLKSVNALTNAMTKAMKSHHDIGTTSVLKNYQNQYRLLSSAMYHGTNTVISLFTNDKLKRVRSLALRLSNTLPFFKETVVKQLTKTS